MNDNTDFIHSQINANPTGKKGTLIALLIPSVKKMPPFVMLRFILSFRSKAKKNPTLLGV